MIIECTQENLAQAIHIVSRFVGTRGTLPVLGNILLSTTKGQIRLAATDLEVGIQTWIGGKVEVEGALTVPARLLADFVTTNTDPRVRVEVKDTTLHLTSDHFTATIRGIAATEFPLMPDIKRKEGIIIPTNDFREAVQQTVFATAIDETRPILTGVLLRCQDKKLTFAATDSYRLAERTIELPQAHQPFTVIIPARTLQELGRILSDKIPTIELYFGENQLLFVFGETQLISRVIDGSFPDYEQIIPKQTTTEVRVQKGQLAQVMKMASFFARESANNVQLAVKDGAPVEVTAISPQIGDARSKLDGTVKGEPIEIAFNAKFMLDALAVLPGDQVDLFLAGKLQPGILRPVGPKNYLYLIMPLRVDV